jgi:hypothetical protein
MGLLVDYVRFGKIAETPVLPSPTGKVLLLGNSIRKEYADRPTFEGDGSPYLYAILFGEATYFIHTSKPVAYGPNVLQIYVLEWRTTAIKCLKYLLRRHVNAADALGEVMATMKVFNPKPRMKPDYRGIKKHFSRIYSEHAYMWSNGSIEDEIRIPPFVDIISKTRMDSIDVRLKFSCRGALIFIYPFAIAIEIGKARVIILEEYLLFYSTHIQLSGAALDLLASIGLPIKAQCMRSARDELLKLASVDALAILPSPISEEVYPHLWRVYDGMKDEFYYE